MIQCYECMVWFEVVWANDGFSRPEFCPMCGEEIDYTECESDE